LEAGIVKTLLTAKVALLSAHESWMSGLGIPLKKSIVLAVEVLIHSSQEEECVAMMVQATRTSYGCPHS